MNSPTESPELQKVRSRFSVSSSFIELTGTVRLLLIPETVGSVSLGMRPEIHEHRLGHPLTDKTIVCPRLTLKVENTCAICEVVNSISYDSLPCGAWERPRRRYLNVAQEQDGRWVAKVLRANQELYVKIADRVDIDPRLLRGLPLRIKCKQGKRKEHFSVSAYKRYARLSDAEFSRLVRNQVDFFRRYGVPSPQFRKDLATVAKWHRRAVCRLPRGGRPRHGYIGCHPPHSGRTGQ